MFDNRVGYQLKHVSHALRLAMDEALRDIALTTPQYAALSVLEAHPGSSSAALARDCFVTPQTMNEIAGLLAAVGFVERRPHAENRRIVQLFLTERGTLALAQAHTRIFAIEEHMLADLSGAERQLFADALATCLQSLTDNRA